MIIGIVIALLLSHVTWTAQPQPMPSSSMSQKPTYAQATQSLSTSFHVVSSQEPVDRQPPSYEQAVKENNPPSYQETMLILHVALKVLVSTIIFF